jgi:hypothetical protein
MLNQSEYVFLNEPATSSILHKLLTLIFSNSATRRCTSALRQYIFNLLSMPTSAALEAVLDIFVVHKSELTVSDFILTLLEDSKLQTHLCTLVLVKESSAIITALSRHSCSADSVFTWANGVVKKKYIESIKELTANEECHFNASHASPQALNDFRIEDMGLKMKDLAPDLWNILGILLSGHQRSQSQCDLDRDQIMADLVTGDEAGLPEVEGDVENVDENGTFRQCSNRCYIFVVLQNGLHDLDLPQSESECIEIGYTHSPKANRASASQCSI